MENIWYKLCSVLLGVFSVSDFNYFYSFPTDPGEPRKMYVCTLVCLCTSVSEQTVGETFCRKRKHIFINIYLYSLPKKLIVFGPPF